MSPHKKVRIPECLVRYVACCACAGDGGTCEGHPFEVVREGRATYLVGDTEFAEDDIRSIARGELYDAIESTEKAAARRWVSSNPKT